MKLCNTCNTTKDYNNFFKDRTKNGGYATQCISCKKKYTKDNAEKIAEKRKIYDLKNKERIKKRREDFESTPERIQYLKEWNSKNHDKNIAKSRRHESKPERRLYKKIKYKEARLNPNTQARRKNWSLQKEFNITLNDYLIMYENQKEKCAICTLPVTANYKWLSVDHCHTTGKIRGLLCNPCNLALGNFRDSIDSLKNAIKYLEAHKDMPSESNKDVKIGSKGIRVSKVSKAGSKGRK